MSYRKKITNPEQHYYDRTEILKTDFRLQDRIDGIVGMTVEKVHVKSDSFIMVCSDEKNGRGMRIQLARSGYGDGSFLRLSATEIVYKTAQERKDWMKKEIAKKQRLVKKLLERHSEPHPQYGLPKEEIEAKRNEERSKAKS